MHILARRLPTVVIAASIESRSDIFVCICVCMHIYTYIYIYMIHICAS